MMLSKGEKIFAITRRLFEGDLRRHFIGEIQEVSEAVIRVRGYTFVFDESSKQFLRRQESITRIISLIDAGIVIMVLPNEAILEEIQYVMDSNQRMITDRKTFKINVSEYGVNR